MAFSYVPWGHHTLIMTKCEDVEEALFYIKLVIEKGLSRNALDDYIRSDYYNVSGKALTNFSEKLPVTQGKLAQEILKSNYDLGNEERQMLRTRKNLPSGPSLTQSLTSVQLTETSAPVTMIA